MISATTAPCTARQLERERLRERRRVVHRLMQAAEQLRAAADLTAEAGGDADAIRELAAKVYDAMAAGVAS